LFQERMRMSYSNVLFYRRALTDSEIQSLYTYNVVPTAGLEVFVDPTFYNGTHFLDLSGKGRHAALYGVSRVPTEVKWLYLVRNLHSDNKLHLRYVPPGSVFRIRYGGLVYEWRVPEDCVGRSGLCEDFAVDVAAVVGATTLPMASVELVYRSDAVRVYVPRGFRVVVEGPGFSQTHDVDSRNYVDFYVPEDSIYTVRILGYQRSPNVRVETAGERLRIVVTDEAGYALAGAKIWIYGERQLIAMGTVNDLGFYELDKSLISGTQLRIVVQHLKDGTHYSIDKLVSLTSPQPQPIQPQPVTAPQPSTAPIAVLLLLGAAAVVLVALASRRRR